MLFFFTSQRLLANLAYFGLNVECSQSTDVTNLGHFVAFRGKKSRQIGAQEKLYAPLLKNFAPF